MSKERLGTLQKEKAYEFDNLKVELDAYKKECARLRDSITPTRDRAGLTEAIQETNISDVEQEKHRLITKNLSSDI